MTRSSLRAAPKKNQSVILVFFGSVLVLGSFGAWQARPLYQWTKKVRALRLVDEVDRHLENGGVKLALPVVAKAWRLAPEEPRVLRAGAQATLAAASPESVFFLQQLQETGAATADDRQNLVKAFLSTGDLEHARNLCEILLRESPESIDLHGTAIDVFLASKNFEEALRLGEKLLLLDPANTTHRFQVSRLRLVHGTAEDQELAFRYLLTIARDPTPTGLEAIRLLMRRENLSAIVHRELLDLIELHPLVDESLSVQAIFLKMHLYPLKRQELLKAAMAERREWPPSELTPFVFNLVVNGESEFLVDNIPVETALKNSGVFLNYLGSLVALERWDELAKILDRPGLPLSDAGLHAVKAYCVNRARETDLARAHLVDAVASLKRLGAFHEAPLIARFSEKMGHLDLAEATFEFAAGSKNEFLASHAYTNLLRLARQAPNTGKLRKLAGRYHCRVPYRQEVEDRALYLNTLIGIEIEKTLQKILESAASGSLSPSPRITAALALYRMHDFESAAAFCHDCDPNQLTQGQKAVWAAVTAAAGRPEAALAVARELAPGQLLEEERLLLSSIPGAQVASVTRH